MDWIVLTLIGAGASFFFLFNRGTLAPESKAKDWILKGAKVIDVRTEDEYRQQHLPGTLNVPLDKLRAQIPHEAPDKDAVLLLHCVAGGRSAIGCRTLKQMGYRKCYNLGSYRRAERILGGVPQASAA